MRSSAGAPDASPSAPVDTEQVLAFRLARAGLALRDDRTLAQAAACPLSDFSRDAALVGLAARSTGVTREAYADAVDRGELVVAHLVRAAIHAVAPAAHGALGPALLARDDEELGAQLGRQVQRICAQSGRRPTAALAEVALAVAEILELHGAVTKDELHDALRGRVHADLMPWCKGCAGHHVAPMLWRSATVAGGVRLDAARRYVPGDAGPAPPADAVRRFLSFYAPSTSAAFGEWAGLARPHARRLWDQVAPELAEVRVGTRAAWALAGDVAELDDPPPSRGVRLVGPGDPVLQPANRAELVVDPAVRKRLFRPVASPGAVLHDGRLAGLWRARAKGRRTEVAVVALGPLPRDELEEEARRVAALRGSEPSLVLC